MTVRELRAALAALPPEADSWAVVLRQDAEGNAFSPLRDCATGLYEPHETAQWYGDFVPLEDLGPTDDQWRPDALSLWPVR